MQWPRFRQYVCLFLSWQMALSSTAVFAEGDPPLRLLKSMKRLYTTNEPLDERARLEYEESGGRKDALMAIFQDSPEAKTFLNLYAELVGSDPQFEALLAKHNVDPANVQNFFAETVLLFRLVKNHHDPLARSQFSHWLESVDAVDFRRLDKVNARRWTEVLLELFKAALEITGPWNEGDYQYLEVFFAEQMTQSAPTWAARLNGYLPKVENSSTADPKMKNAHLLRQLLGSASGAPFSSSSLRKNLFSSLVPIRMQFQTCC